jgi:hypothetical protein
MERRVERYTKDFHEFSGALKIDRARILF